jgi:retron-type reverse transcriptase
LGIAALEDKIVQQAVVTILNQIYEVDFKGFSYGFRPGRSPHQALDALVVGLERKKVNWVLDADIRGFFDNMSHEWTTKFIEHRVADRRILRLIRKWLKAGVSEDGHWSERSRVRRKEQWSHRCSPTCISTTCSTFGRMPGAGKWLPAMSSSFVMPTIS